LFFSRCIFFSILCLILSSVTASIFISFLRLHLRTRIQ
jgi:hypothetical protein